MIHMLRARKIKVDLTKREKLIAYREQMKKNEEKAKRLLEKQQDISY